MEAALHHVSKTCTHSRAHDPDMRIEAANVSRIVRGGHTVVRDVSFTIESGEMVAIVGASGAGKSSLTELIHFLLGANPDAIFTKALKQYSF